MTKYTDRTDDSLVVSLHEQGCIRNPDTTKTIMMIFHHHKERHIAVSTFISEDDVIDALVEVNQGDSGFFDYIGESLEFVLDNLDEKYLSHYISALNDYNGWFNNNLMYDKG